jgi:hypothetical protein
VDLTTLGNPGSIPEQSMQDFTYNVILEHVSLQEPRVSSDNYLYTKTSRLYITSWYLAPEVAMISHAYN